MQAVLRPPPAASVCAFSLPASSYSLRVMLPSACSFFTTRFRPPSPSVYLPSLFNGLVKAMNAAPPESEEKLAVLRVMRMLEDKADVTIRW